MILIEHLSLKLPKKRNKYILVELEMDIQIQYQKRRPETPESKLVKEI